MKIQCQAPAQGYGTIRPELVVGSVSLIFCLEELVDAAMRCGASSAASRESGGQLLKLAAGPRQSQQTLLLWWRVA